MSTITTTTKTKTTKTQHYDTIVIGGGQAGLSTGYFLQQQAQDFLILDASQRIGDSWRKRWDSLRLFTPARYDGLAGMPFPASPHYFPTKDEMADYLEQYAQHFDLPVRTGVRVDRLARQGDRFVLTAGDERYAANQVVVAMANFQRPRVPDFAGQLDEGIVQLHSKAYRHPDQLQPGPVLIVGAGNSGTEIGMELVATHPIWMAGPATGHVPFRIESRAAQHLLIPFVLRFLFHRILTVATPIGRKKRPQMIATGDPLVRIKPQDMQKAGIQRVPRVTGVRAGQPVLEDGRVLDVANVIWCTGFHPGFDWIDLPIHGELEPEHERGIVQSVPGLYFVGLTFQYSLSSTMIHGVERDARRIVQALVARAKELPASATHSEPARTRALA